MSADPVVAVIAQRLWEVYVVEVGRSMPAGLADTMAVAVTCGAAAGEYCTFEANGHRFRRHCPCISRLTQKEAPCSG